MSAFCDGLLLAMNFGWSLIMIMMAAENNRDFDWILTAHQANKYEARHWLVIRYR
jgi:hypothetical protein